MNTLDVVILVLVASLAFGGYRVGFLARAASWIGLGAGLFLAVRTLPAIVGSLGDAEPSTRLLVSTAVLVAAGAAGQALGLFLGHWVRSALPPGGLRTLDRAAGGLAGGLVVLVALWLILPSMAEVQGYPARLARTSTVAGLVHEVFPPAPDAMQTLRRLVEESGFPRVFEDLRPAPDPGAPPEDLGLRPEVAAQVSASTVQVRGQACSRVQEGSGFAAGTDLVVTNAHVVAGEQPGATEVLRPDGRRLAATVALFDPARDLAVLRVNGLGQRALVVGDAEPGDEGAVFGHPGGQRAVRAAPAAINDQISAVGRDLYNRRSTRRAVFILAAELRPGDSGGPLVDTEGRVVGVAFAIAPDRPGTAYALTSTELRAVLELHQASPTARASTGACLAR